MRVFFAVFLIASQLGASAPGLKQLDLTKAKSKVEFLAVGKPSMLKIRGVAKTPADKSPLQGSLVFKGGAVSGTAFFLLDTLDTDNSLRNTHMKEKYLQVGKFPKAEMQITELKIPPNLQTENGKAEDLDFKGKLTIHGVPQEVSGKVGIVRAENRAEFNFNFSTKITKHGIEIPSFLGVTVAEDVKISVTVEGPLS